MIHLRLQAEELLRALMLKTNEYQNPVDPEMVGQLMIITESAFEKIRNEGYEKGKLEFKFGNCISCGEAMTTTDGMNELIRVRNEALEEAAKAIEARAQRWYGPHPFSIAAEECRTLKSAEEKESSEGVAIQPEGESK